MSSPYQYQGKATVYVDGAEYPTLDGATFTPSGDTREVVKGARVYGFSATPTEASLEAKFPNNGALSIETINNWDNVTAEFRPDVGRAHMMANAWVAEPAKLTNKGEISVKFNAVESKEI